MDEEADSKSVLTASSTPPGLLLRWTPTIRDFLLSASSTSTLGSHHIDHRSDDGGAVPYSLLRDAWVAAPPATRPRWCHLLSGSTLVFTSPQPRHKSDELKARLARLQDMADSKAYSDLVKDVTRNQHEETEYFSSYREQLGFGLHVIVIMFTGYLVGYALFRSQLGGSPVLHAAGGIFGMVVGMLVETLLFIIRASNFDEKKLKVSKKSYQSRPKKD